MQLQYRCDDSRAAIRRRLPQGTGRAGSRSGSWRSRSRSRISRKYLDTAPLEYLECRDMRHGSVAHDVEPVGRDYKQTVRCPRCGTLRTRLVDGRTGIAGPWKSYNHPEGYLRKGQGRMTREQRGQMRLVYIVNGS